MMTKIASQKDLKSSSRRRVIKKVVKRRMIRKPRRLCKKIRTMMII